MYAPARRQRLSPLVYHRRVSAKRRSECALPINAFIARKRLARNAETPNLTDGKPSEYDRRRYTGRSARLCAIAPLRRYSPDVDIRTRETPLRRRRTSFGATQGRKFATNRAYRRLLARGLRGDGVDQSVSQRNRYQLVQFVQRPARVLVDAANHMARRVQRCGPAACADDLPGDLARFR